MVDAYIWLLYPGGQKHYYICFCQYIWHLHGIWWACPCRGGWLGHHFQWSSYVSSLGWSLSSCTAMSLVNDPPIHPTLADPSVACTMAKFSIPHCNGPCWWFSNMPYFGWSPSTCSVAEHSSSNIIPVSYSPEILTLGDILYDQYEFTNSTSKSSLLSSYFITMLASKICEDKASCLDWASLCKHSCKLCNKPQ